MATHAKLSPSSSVRWLTCQASVIMQAGKPDTSSIYAAEGTAAHFLAEQCLVNECDAGHYEAQLIEVYQDGDTRFYDGASIKKPMAYQFDVDRGMIDHVQSYVDLVRGYAATSGGELLVEQKLPLDPITGEAGATGTSDAVILSDDEIIIIDLKYGQGDKTTAPNNSQLMMYALAALNTYDMLCDADRIRMVISQPRRDHVSEFTMAADDLRAWGEGVSAIATNIRTLTPKSDLTGLFAPSAEACKYCKAAGECKAYAEHSYKIVSDQFTDISEPVTMDQVVTLADATYDEATLSAIYQSLPTLKQFVKDIENHVYMSMMKGATVPGFKLIPGKLGARKWADPAEAEAALKTMRVPVADRYNATVISPTDAEKLNKAGTLGSRQWNNLQALIVRNEGAPTIVSADDRREALNITPIADQFDDLI